MPIRPENKHRYPADWKQVRERILRRANWCCEHPGCRARHGVTGYWHDSRFQPMPDALWRAGAKPGDLIRCADGADIKIIKIVLTIAHLDHTPENCSDENLRAWCQRHHLAYDAQHHKQTAYLTRKRAAATVDMFEAHQP